MYSRAGDYDLQTADTDDVDARIRLIKQSGATLMISLHCNAFTDSSEWGAQVFFNASNNPENKRLAGLVHQALAEDIDTPREPSSRLDHFMLNHSAVPSVTVEMGFLSNPKEEGLLGSHSHQQKIAASIHRAIVGFFAPTV